MSAQAKSVEDRGPHMRDGCKTGTCLCPIADDADFAFITVPARCNVLAATEHQMAYAYLMPGGAETMYGVSDAFADVARQHGRPAPAAEGQAA